MSKLSEMDRDHLAGDLIFIRGSKRYVVKAYFDDIFTIEVDAMDDDEALQLAKEDIEARIEKLFDKSIFLEIEGEYDIWQKK